MTVQSDDGPPDAQRLPAYKICLTSQSTSVYSKAILISYFESLQNNIEFIRMELAHLPLYAVIWYKYSKNLGKLLPLWRILLSTHRQLTVTVLRSGEKRAFPPDSYGLLVLKYCRWNIEVLALNVSNGINSSLEYFGGQSNRFYNQFNRYARNWRLYSLYIYTRVELVATKFLIIVPGYYNIISPPWKSILNIGWQNNFRDSLLHPNLQTDLILLV